MIWESYKRSEHLEELPFAVQDIHFVAYIRIGYDQYWRNPKGGWEKTDYREVLETIEKLEMLAAKALAEV